ncbi:hypothetical protein WME75_09415 [Sorangium sp. So ce1014]|uniref:hypothetical protein n=1 Tax=Sorangium sp. So ce1014 TaxID=3133326 RepID=UPI003F62E4C6
MNKSLISRIQLALALGAALVAGCLALGSPPDASADPPADSPAEQPDEATAEVELSLAANSCTSVPCGIISKTTCEISCIPPLKPDCYCHCETHIGGVCIEENPKCRCIRPF